MADNRIISIVRWGWVWYEKLFGNEEAVIRRRLWWRFDKICGTSQICGNLSKKRLKSIELTKLDGRVREFAP